MATLYDRVRETLEQAELGVESGDAGQVRMAQFVALMGISREMATRIDDLNATIAAMRAGGGTSGTDTRRFPLTKARGIEKVPGFSGNKSEFIDWTKRVEIFLGDAPGLRNMLKEVKTEYRNEKVNDVVLSELQRKYGQQDDDIEWYSGQVHSVLIPMTTGF